MVCSFGKIYVFSCFKTRDEFLSALHNVVRVQPLFPITTKFNCSFISFETSSGLEQITVVARAVFSFFLFPRYFRLKCSRSQQDNADFSSRS